MDRRTDAWRDWATLSEGCYLLRTNVTDWSAEDLWQAYIQLTEAEAAFRIHKSDLRIRPVWHQNEDRVLAHILVCFLAYVLWKTLHQMVQGRRPGRRATSHVRRTGQDQPGRRRPAHPHAASEIRRRCVTPTDRSPSDPAPPAGASPAPAEKS